MTDNYSTFQAMAVNSEIEEERGELLDPVLADDTY